MMTLKEFKALHHDVDRIFDEANRRGLSLPELADAVGVHYDTVWRLENAYTMYPRAATIYLLARAVGLKFVLELTKHKLKLKRA